MKKYKSTKGISFLICIGSYGGFHFTKSASAYHLCLGWIALTLFMYDVENKMAQILKG
ncbi:hypothetical protein [uncultured Lacinutrix sp.]|uniref:hypothetical protein n=1 Tax=uncultured Lacinutrix sp. TaxID=574032 RepID=UPI002611895B|nr:hypothetical protein [uncultured Lacinutrix sp.]